MNEETLKMINFIRRRSREIAPDYPRIMEDLDIFEHLWAITSSYEGVSLACEDLHKYITFLLKQLNWTPEQGIKEYEQVKEK